MKTIKGNLILEKDTVFDEDLKVEGHITCKDGNLFDLTVKGDINARDINAWNIDAWNIDAGDINARDINAYDIDAGDINAVDINAWDINARDINAVDINAWDINAWNIICESRKKNTETAKTMARVFITCRSKFQRKEW